MIQALQNFFHDKKKLIFFYIGLLASFFVIRGFIYLSKSLQVFEFIFLSIVIGLLPAFVFRNAFPYKNLINWLTNAGILGILFIPFIFLLLGWWNFNILFFYSINFLYITALLCMITLIIIMDSEHINKTINLDNISWVDFLFYGILIIFSVFLAFQNFSRYYVRWDTFTYWGVDAKYIFDYNKLRNTRFDIFSYFPSYSSFFTILISLIYDIYGRVVEQFASFINVYLNFLAIFAIYNTAIKQNPIKKFFITTILITISYTADSTAYMFSLYADVFSAFMLIVFTIILTSNYKHNVRTYSIRFFLLSLISYIFTLIKPDFIFISIILFFAIVAFDFNLLRNNLKKIITNPIFLFSIAILITAMYSHHQYLLINRNNFYAEKPRIIRHFSMFDKTLISYLNYIKVLLKFLFKRSPFISSLLLMSMISFIFVLNPLKQKKYMYSLFLTSLIFFVFVGGYVMKQRSLTSGSLVRYTSIIMYMIPLIFIHMHVNPSIRFVIEKKIVMTIFIIALVLINSTLFIKMYSSYPIFDSPIGFVEGSYESALPKYYNLAQQVISHTGEDAKILIADDNLSTNRTGNMHPPAIYIRYFLMYNSVGGQYNTTINNLLPYATKKKAEYILLLTYDRSLPQCDSIFEENSNYIIVLDNNILQYDNICPFSDEDIIKIAN